MNFRLVYEGPLKASRGAADKQTLRRYFQPQLRELMNRKAMAHIKRLVVMEHQSITFVKQGDFKFAPIFTEKLEHVVKLNITMLTPEEPGRVVTQGGDLDNRLKTLFDALRVPKVGELPSGDTPSEDEQPFFCLLEDDALISAVSVETDRLLRPVGQSDVVLIIQVLPESISPSLGMVRWQMG